MVLPIHPGAKRYYEEQGLTVEAEEAQISADAANRKSELVLGTGNEGGTYYPLGGEIANIWNNYIDGMNVTNTETGASVENLVSIRDGTMDLGLLFTFRLERRWREQANLTGPQWKTSLSSDTSIRKWFK